ncbi:MAG: hypothetical protein ABEJ28_07950 [Salinigranum sp.]
MPTETVRLWLVERSYDDRNLITMTYATPSGDRSLTREVSATIIDRRGGGITAAVDVDPDRLEPVDDEGTRERYATEAARVAERRDPDERV